MDSFNPFKPDGWQVVEQADGFIKTHNGDSTVIMQQAPCGEIHVGLYESVGQQVAYAFDSHESAKAERIATDFMDGRTE